MWGGGYFLPRAHHGSRKGVSASSRECHQLLEVGGELHGRRNMTRHQGKDLPEYVQENQDKRRQEKHQSTLNM